MISVIWEPDRTQKTCTKSSHPIQKHQSKTTNDYVNLNPILSQKLDRISKTRKNTKIIVP